MGIQRKMLSNHVTLLVYTSGVIVIVIISHKAHLGNTSKRLKDTSAVHVYSRWESEVQSLPQPTLSLLVRDLTG